MNPKHIVLVNDGLGPNKGDQAILLSMLDSIRKAVPEARITVLPNSNMRRISQYRAFWGTLKDADLFIYGGGQEIQDHASLAFLVSGLLKIFLAKLRFRRIFCYALGVGPVATSLGKWLSRFVLNQVDLITVRDEDSRAYLIELGVTKPPCFVTADPSFLLSRADGTDIQRIFCLEDIPKSNGPRVAIAPRRWFHYNHYVMPMRFRAKFRTLKGENAFGRLKQTIAEAADHLVKTHMAQVIYVPMRSAGGRFDPGQDDDRVSREILELMTFKEQAFVLKGEYSPKELQAFLGNMDLVIGMRMHSLILASTMNVPVMGISISPKFPSFFKSIGQDRYLMPLERIDTSTLVDRIDAALSERTRIQDELTQRTVDLRHLAASNVGYVTHLLKTDGSS